MPSSSASAHRGCGPGAGASKAWGTCGLQALRLAGRGQPSIPGPWAAGRPGRPTGAFPDPHVRHRGEGHRPAACDRDRRPSLAGPRDRGPGGKLNATPMDVSGTTHAETSTVPTEPSLVGAETGEPLQLMGHQQRRGLQPGFSSLSPCVRTRPRWEGRGRHERGTGGLHHPDLRGQNT